MIIPPLAKFMNKLIRYWKKVSHWGYSRDWRQQAKEQISTFVQKYVNSKWGEKKIATQKHKKMPEEWSDSLWKSFPFSICEFFFWDSFFCLLLQQFCCVWFFEAIKRSNLRCSPNQQKAQQISTVTMKNNGYYGMVWYGINIYGWNRTVTTSPNQPTSKYYTNKFIWKSLDNFFSLSHPHILRSLVNFRHTSDENRRKQTYK